jgi:hypothetical protein
MRPNPYFHFDVTFIMGVLFSEVSPDVFKVSRESPGIIYVGSNDESLSAVAVLLATIGTARGTGVGHGRSGHANDIDEQRTSSPISWRSAFQEVHVVGKIIAGELRVAKFNDKVCDIVATKDRERGIGIIFNKTVLSLTPQRNESAGLHMPGHPRRTISETHGYGIHSAQDKLSFAEAHTLRVLHEENVHIL